MRNCFKKLIYIIVFIGFSLSHAGSYEDFFVAIKQDNDLVVSDLLKRGFDANTPNPAGEHGLMLALREPSLKVAETLISWPKTDIDTRNSQDESPLMIASLKGHLDIVRKLIERDADVNKTGWTPLHYAATGGDVAVIRLLLEHSAYIDASSPNGSTPLMMAAMYGTASAVKLLLEEGADPLLKNDLGLSAIDFANRARREESAQIIAAFVRARQPRGTW
ncbi:MAG: ankyrin repeat domain-containing protein [Gammaproteobacteria bacterium]|nr:ankyrin repeat domain-containing protein [Gammaproteobacteria bacterium]MBU0788677.1 ankyrin repeat domain-containing protein [Gammaproteobacteria bacterium]MBU0814704.1 ankyrin repeat domain-containing protein [Gammaproteobacteria bacterium]MBU1786453.1 ankyrin repeat domain-containing protein [Gammaproteobacteria bacterium]